MNEPGSSAEGGVRSVGTPPPVPPVGAICLFLDVDGTLLEFADHPHSARAEDSLLAILRLLGGRLQGALALISGRRIHELDRLLHPLVLPAAGLHGAERRDAGGALSRAELPDTQLGEAREQLRALVAAHPGLYFEDKGEALAIHYRALPQMRERVQQSVARIAGRLHPTYEVLQGELVVEIKPAGISKATAIEQFMREAPFRGRTPVFVGDDITDRDGFDEVRRHDGMTVAVGDRVRAQWHLPDPQAVRNWLHQIAHQQAPQ